MNTIYDGTFVLGQTSATNFVGGTGITVDSPSEGVVRISNDETVLWEGTPTNSNIQCSEELSKFERVTLYGRWNYNSSQAIYAETTIPGSAGTVQVGGLGLNTKTTTPTDFFCTYVDYSISGKNLTANAKLRIQIRTGQNSSTSDTILIYKIVGINRISGSNT
jgi:hypothetical protein